jgi:hypothetical protein
LGIFDNKQIKAQRQASHLPIAKPLIPRSQPSSGRIENNMIYIYIYIYILYIGIKEEEENTHKRKNSKQKTYIE